MHTEKMNTSSYETHLQSIEKAIEIMETVALEYRSLTDKADNAQSTAMLIKTQPAQEQNEESWQKFYYEYLAKSKEAAHLIMGLPGQLQTILQNVDNAIKEPILAETNAFAITAKKLLESNRPAGMGAILSSLGDNINNRNHLKMLIDRLRQKFVM
jgi:hypothetical protein